MSCHRSEDTPGLPSRLPEMRSNFNTLLMVLAVLDIMIVIISIWDHSAVKIFQLHLELYVYMFPYFWYPLKEKFIFFLYSTLTWAGGLNH